MIFPSNFSYGHAQSRRLPIGDYRFLTRSEIRSDFPRLLRKYVTDCDDVIESEFRSESRDSREVWEEIEDDQGDWDDIEDIQKGFIAEVTLSYPRKLHSKHRSFPLAPEKRCVKSEELSKYQQKCHKVLKTKPGKISKLIGTFYPRKKYVLHAANLKLYLKLGMKLKKVHRVLTFTESNFLKRYIQFCTQMRSQAKSDFEKRLFKLMSNSNFGKFIENSSRYLDMKIVTTKKDAKFWISSPLYHSYRIISDKITAIFLNRKQNVIRQAYAIGFSILDLSKEFMYRSYYEIIKPKLGPTCRVLFSDTDSLFIQCQTKDPLRKLSSLLDTSNFPPDHALFRKDRKAKLGYFKSEVGCNKISKFVGLRSKCYAFKTEKGEKDVKCKGLSKAYKKEIGLEHFEKCLKKIRTISATQRLLRSKNNSMEIVKMKKQVLSSYDDKHYLLACGTCSVPFNSQYITKFNDYCTECKV